MDTPPPFPWLARGCIRAGDARHRTISGPPRQPSDIDSVVFNSARMIVFMATGEKKANTLAEVLSDRYNPELYPAQRIRSERWQVDLAGG